MFRYCVNCGGKYETESKMAKYCPTCKKENLAAAKEKQKEYAKQRTEKLGLTNIQIYKEDKEILKKIATEKNITISEVVKTLVEKI